MFSIAILHRCQPHNTLFQRNILHRLTGLLIILSWPLSAPAAIPGSSIALAYIGNDSITVEEFAREYYGYRQAFEGEDSLQARLDLLQQLVMESIYDQYGRETGLDRDPSILRAGYLAWREALLRGVAFGIFPDEINIPPEENEAEYRYRYTVLLTRYITLPDSTTATESIEKLMAGESFESVALQAAEAPTLMANPGIMGWKFPHQLDSSYARHAYQLEPGQFSALLKNGSAYTVIQLLGKEFRPDHGHFERVKYLQTIAAEKRLLKAADTAREALNQWSSELDLRWRTLPVRRVLRAGILEDLEQAPLTENQSVELADEVLFTLDNEPYTLDWLLSQLELLLPEEKTSVTTTETLRNLVGQILIWDQLLMLSRSAPRADSLMAAADSVQLAVIAKAVRDSIQAQIIRQAVPNDTGLRQFLASEQNQYTLPALVSIEEIVVRDSILAAAIRDSLSAGNVEFGTLASRHTEREWAVNSGGRLGWVPLAMYGSAGPTLVEASGRNPNRLVGPLKVEDYFIVAQPDGYVPAQTLSYSALKPRIQQDWIEANRERLFSEWIEQQGLSYPVIIDTSLVATLQLDEAGWLTLPVITPDSSTSEIDTTGSN